MVKDSVAEEISLCDWMFRKEGDQTANRKICAGYYRRYDRKVVYVIFLVTDADTGEESW